MFIVISLINNDIKQISLFISSKRRTNLKMLQMQQYFS
nr:MAG TPA: hypothetical protein [Caudoviricetes sp.]